MKSNLLKAKFRVAEMTQAQIAEEIGLSPGRFSMKLNQARGAQFTQEEIMGLKRLLYLSADEIDTIFFSPEVSCKSEAVAQTANTCTDNRTGTTVT